MTEAKTMYPKKPTIEEVVDARRKAKEKAAPPIKATPYVFCDPSTIKPRDWLFERTMLRGYVTGTFAAGAGAKTQMVLCNAMAMSCGFDLESKRPFKRGPLRVWYISVEDEEDEVDRRFAAIRKFFGITQEQIGGRLFMDTDRQGNFVVAKSTAQGMVVEEMIVQAVIDQIKNHQIDLVIIDPLIGIHHVNENISGDMNTVLAQLRLIADQGDCAVHVLHHVKKGGDGTAEDGRGSSATKDACRAITTLSVITEQEAKTFGIPATKRRYYIRKNPNAKSNLSAPSDDCEFYFMNSVSLDNGNDVSDADNIGVPSRWTPPGAFSDISMPDCRAIWDRLESEKHPEKTCCADSQNANYIGKIIAEVLDWDYLESKEKIKRMVAAWSQPSGCLKKDSKINGKGRLVPFYRFVRFKEGNSVGEGDGVGI
jgi:hypothetical protein